jgi:NAD(P)-dependent dehydrogenase (short-subunit alcohol dehydrogenase family)
MRPAERCEWSTTDTCPSKGRRNQLTVLEATARFPKEAGIARYGKPEEIAELMAFLVSPGVRWMTGSTLRMDGGEVKSI